MFSMLSKLFLNKKIASFYVNYNETNKFIVGKIVALNKEEIVINMLSLEGEDDGYVYVNIKNIFRIEEDNKYTEKMMKLYTISSPDISFDITDNSNILAAVLDVVLVQRLIITIELFNSGYDDIIGFVDEVCDGKCIINQINEYGYKDGFSYITTDSITRISFLRQEESVIMKLYEMNTTQ